MTEAAEARQPKGRYRKVEVKMWGDEKFRRLTPMPPCGQGLWLYLITGPHTGPIPGLFRAGRAALAEELGWGMEGFDKAFSEAYSQGMVKADFKSRVVWVPKAITHNRPESPNVVRGWGAEFNMIPECALKSEALDHLRATVCGLGEAFAKAFNETFGKPLSKAYGKTMPNQEQEQEQQQEQDQEEEEPTIVGLSSASGVAVTGDESVSGDLLGDSVKPKPKKNGPPPCPHLEIVDLFHEVLPELPEVRTWEGTRRNKLAARWKADPSRQSIEWWRQFFLTVRKSGWLMGKVNGHDGTPFKCTLEWLVSPENFAKVIEDFYTRRGVR
ncbi:TPA: hypothetical protein ACN3MR_002876 [Stenotrophomonas maltophilia]